MSRKKIIPVLFEIFAVSGFAFLELISISLLENFICEIYQIHQFGMLDSDRLIIGVLFVVYLILAAEETSKMPQASENGFGTAIALLIWSMIFSFLLTYERGRYFNTFCNKDTALLYVSFCCFSFLSAFMHPKREEVTN
jgi:hypothetical protein